MKEVRGLAGVLAQAPVVSAAFGRRLGFILMITALVVVFALGSVALLIANKGATLLIDLTSGGRVADRDDSNLRPDRLIVGYAADTDTTMYGETR